LNKTVELVNEWAKFEENYPNAGIDEFCRYYIINARQKQSQEELFQGAIPPPPDISLVKLMGRLTRMFLMYADPAIKENGIRHLDDFLFLNVIHQRKEPRKTEVIYEAMTEVSTGLLILTYLKQKKLITEFDDPVDKRSKRVKMTDDGIKLLFKCYHDLSDVGQMMFGDVPKDDINLCIQLLKNVDSKFAKLWYQHKGKSLDEVIQSIKEEQ